MKMDGLKLPLNFKEKVKKELSDYFYTGTYLEDSGYFPVYPDDFSIYIEEEFLS